MYQTILKKDIMLRPPPHNLFNIPPQIIISFRDFNHEKKRNLLTTTKFVVCALQPPNKNLAALPRFFTKDKQITLLLVAGEGVRAHYVGVCIMNGIAGVWGLQVRRVVVECGLRLVM